MTAQLPERRRIALGRCDTKIGRDTVRDRLTSQTCLGEPFAGR